jgi:selenocysteine-specific elongation factor
MFVLGTAGHVDHGKSSLIHALTSIDPDRLPEEKAREMTIDLGFAWMELPSCREVSIVDVPGHERFINNMLAGIGGIDLALLIVDATESVMPQTREHLAILDILQVKTGIVVITKADLVDHEMVQLVKAEVEDVLAPTTFKDASILATSAWTGEGLQQLKIAIDSLLDTTEPRKNLGRPRLPVDRCFSVAGFGTVVTGTLIDGSLTVGQEVELVPSGQRCRIRGLQTHRKGVKYADPGCRLAVNLSGISRSDIQRGDMITTPGWLQSSDLIDAHFRMIPNAAKSLKHNQGNSFHLYTSETRARVRLLDKKELVAGAEGLVQVHLSDPIPVVKGDMFVVRSSEDTLGGGRVVDAHPKRHRRFQTQVIERLKVIEDGAGVGALLGAIDLWGPCDITTLSRQANLAIQDVMAWLSALVDEERVVLLGTTAHEGNALVYSLGSWMALMLLCQQTLSSFHSVYPLRIGVSREELRNRLGLSLSAFSKAAARLKADKIIREEDGLISLPQHQVSLSPHIQRQADDYLMALKSDPFSPPTDWSIDPQLLAFLVQDGKVVKVSEDVVFSAEAYGQMIDLIVGYAKKHGSITVAQGRDILGTSRKYVLPLMEYLDHQRITRRVGDERVLR